MFTLRSLSERSVGALLFTLWYPSEQSVGELLFTLRSPSERSVGELFFTSRFPSEQSVGELFFTLRSPYEPSVGELLLTLQSSSEHSVGVFHCSPMLNWNSFGGSSRWFLKRLTNYLGVCLLLGDFLHRYFQAVDCLLGRTSWFLFSVNRIAFCISSTNFGEVVVCY